MDRHTKECAEYIRRGDIDGLRKKLLERYSIDEAEERLQLVPAIKAVVMSDSANALISVGLYRKKTEMC